MAASTLSNFTSELRNRNISRPNLYYVEIIPPPIFQSNTRDFVDTDKVLVSMWCHTAMTPQSTISTDDNYIEAGTRRKYAYDQDYQNLTLSFYVDQEFKIKRFFDQWKQAIVPQRRNFGYPDDYTSESINLYIINQSGNETYKYEYTKIYPKSFNTIDLSYAAGTGLSTFTIDFVFEEVYYSSVQNGVVDFSSRPALNSIPFDPPKIALEDSSWKGRGENGTRWTTSTNGIKGVLPY